MKNLFMKISSVALIVLLLPFSGLSQESGYGVFGTLTNPYSGPFSLLTLDTLEKAETLNDIYARYPSSWVANYISVEVSSTCQGITKKAVSTNDILTDEQKDILNRADLGCKINLKVDYVPENSLKDNPARKMNFSLTMIPIFEAKYPGGFQHLKKYLKENIIDQIAETKLAHIKLAKVRFNINEKGQVSNAQVFKTTENDCVNQLILEAIRNMPKWSPAENSKGVKISQEFEFTMGTSMLRCDYKY